MTNKLLSILIVGVLCLMSAAANADSLRQVRYGVSPSVVVKPSETLFLCDQYKALEIRDTDKLYLLMFDKQTSHDNFIFRNWVFEGRVTNKVIMLSPYDNFPYPEDEITSLRQAVQQCANSNGQTLTNLGLSLGETPFDKPPQSSASALSDPIIIKTTDMIQSSASSITDNTVRFRLLERLMNVQLKLGDMKGARKSAVAASETIPDDLGTFLISRFFTQAGKVGVSDSGKRVPDNTAKPAQPTVADMDHIKQLQQKYGDATEVAIFMEAMQKNAANPDNQKAHAARQKQESGDINGAIAVVDTIQDPRTKDLAFSDLSLTQIREFSDFPNSLMAANKIINPEIRANTFMNLLEAKTKDFSTSQ